MHLSPAYPTPCPSLRPHLLQLIGVADPQAEQDVKVGGVGRKSPATSRSKWSGLVAQLGRRADVLVLDSPTCATSSVNPWPLTTELPAVGW